MSANKVSDVKGGLGQKSRWTVKFKAESQYKWEESVRSLASRRGRKPYSNVVSELKILTRSPTQ